MVDSAAFRTFIICTSEIATPVSGTGSTFGYSESFADDLAFNPTTFRGNALGFNTDNQNSNTSLFGYDGDGNPVNYDSSSQNFMFDPEDRLTAMSSPVFAAHYDGDGIRDIRTLGTNTTYYIDDGGSPLLEESYSGTTTTVNLAHGYADGWRETYNGGAAGYDAYVYDPQGSLLYVDYSYSTGKPFAEVFLEDGFGANQYNKNVSTGSLASFNPPNTFGGQYGYYTDTNGSPNGLVLLGQRYYDGGTGRFVNRDPTGTNGGPTSMGSVGITRLLGPILVATTTLPSLVSSSRTAWLMAALPWERPLRLARSRSDCTMEVSTEAIPRLPRAACLRMSAETVCFRQ